jgi:hypothetical protein
MQLFDIDLHFQAVCQSESLRRTFYLSLREEFLLKLKIDRLLPNCMRRKLNGFRQEMLCDSLN